MGGAGGVSVMEIWMHCVLTSETAGYESENVCRVCFSRRAIKYFIDGEDKCWEDAAPPPLPPSQPDPRCN